MEKKVLSQVVKEQIVATFGNHNKAAAATGVNSRSIVRFLSNERSINTSTIAKIWPSLDLEIQPLDVDAVCKDHGLEAAIRYAVKMTGKSELQVANGAGVAQPMLWRFMHKESAMRMDTLDCLWASLPLRIFKSGEPVDDL